jgi:hypothetical protein
LAGGVGRFVQAVGGGECPTAVRATALRRASIVRRG